MLGVIGVLPQPRKTAFGDGSNDRQRGCAEPMRVGAKVLGSAAETEDETGYSWYSTCAHADWAAPVFAVRGFLSVSG